MKKMVIFGTNNHHALLMMKFLEKALAIKTLMGAAVFSLIFVFLMRDTITQVAGDADSLALVLVFLFLVVLVVLGVAGFYAIAEKEIDKGSVTVEDSEKVKTRLTNGGSVVVEGSKEVETIIDNTSSSATPPEKKNLTSQQVSVNNSQQVFLTMAGTLVQHINGREYAIPRQLTPYWPIDPVEDCIGRAADLQRLAAALETSPKVVVVNGLGGIGKTTLLKAWLQGVVQQYDHFVWLELRGDENESGQRGASLMDTVAWHPTLATNLQLQLPDNTPVHDRFVAVMNALRALEGRNLMVIDNAGTELENPTLRGHLPLPPTWQVVLSARSRLNGYTPVPLDRLTPAAAAELFSKHYTYACEAADLTNLLEEIGYHTLTIELLAKTLQNHYGRLTLPQLTAKLRTRQLADPQLQRRISTHHSPEETEVYIHLLTAFDCSGVDADERRLLAQWCGLPPGGFYAAPDIEDWLQIEEAQVRTLHETMKRLAHKGWLLTDDNNHNGLHRMMQQALTYQLAPGWEEWSALVATFTQKMDFDTATNFTQLFPWIPFGEHILDSLPPKDQEREEVSELMNNVGITYLNMGDYTRARDLLEAALASDLKNFGADHPNVAVTQSNLGIVYRNMGDYARARELLEAALASALKNLGADHPTVAMRQSNLANVYQDLGDYARARELLEAALASDLKNFGADHPNVAVSQSNLAIVYKNLGDYTRARDLLEAALASDLKNFGADHPNVAVSQSNLANVYQNLGDYARARDLLEAALASDLKNFGADHPTVAVTQINLGAVLLKEGKRQEARQLFETAYQLSRSVLGEGHPQTVVAKEWLDDV
ncbi:MAG: tetratricopeptide repeat protein [Saprospiraceae bacterium]